MLDLQETVSARVGARDGVVPDVLANLDFRCTIVQVAFGV